MSWKFGSEHLLFSLVQTRICVNDKFSVMSEHIIQIPIHIIIHISDWVTLEMLWFGIELRARWIHSSKVRSLSEWHTGTSDERDPLSIPKINSSWVVVMYLLVRHKSIANVIIFLVLTCLSGGIVTQYSTLRYQLDFSKLLNDLRFSTKWWKSSLQPKHGWVFKRSRWFQCCRFIHTWHRLTPVFSLSDLRVLRCGTDHWSLGSTMASQKDSLLA